MLSFHGSWRGVNLDAKVVTCMVVRTEIGFEIHRVLVGTVELFVYLPETFEKNADHGHFGWFFSDLQFSYHKIVI